MTDEELSVEATEGYLVNNEEGNTEEVRFGREHNLYYFAMWCTVLTNEVMGVLRAMFTGLGNDCAVVVLGCGKYFPMRELWRNLCANTKEVIGVDPEGVGGGIFTSVESAGLEGRPLCFIYEFPGPPTDKYPNCWTTSTDKMLRNIASPHLGTIFICHRDEAFRQGTQDGSERTSGHSNGFTAPYQSGYDRIVSYTASGLRPIQIQAWVPSPPAPH
jgi:hypothetical protein